MIDLEEALAPLVERAPAPPPVDSVARRGRHHRRRRAVTLVAAIALVAVVAAGTIATVAGRDEPRVATVPGEVEHVRVTLLDGSQLDISGPASLGLSDLPMSFNAELDYTDDAPPGFNPSHSLSVTRTFPLDISGKVIGRYPTADGHELVVRRASEGQFAYVEYPGWILGVDWNEEQAYWAAFAHAVQASPNAAGFLVIEAPFGWRLGPTDSPDVQLGDYAFFGPAHTRCSDEPLYVDARCNADATVMTRALDPALADTLDDIKVEYAPVG